MLQLTHAAILLVPSAVGLAVKSVNSGDRSAGADPSLWPPDAGLSLGIFALTVLAAALIEHVSVARFASPVPSTDIVIPPTSDAAAESTDHTVAAVVGITLLVVFWLAQVEWLIAPSSRAGLNVWAVSSAAFGIVLRTLAIRTLGSRFVTQIRCDRAPVKTGIYRFLRHPSEIGLLLIALSAPLILGSWRTTIAAAMVLIPISVWRVGRENSVLRRHQASRNA